MGLKIKEIQSFIVITLTLMTTKQPYRKKKTTKL